MLPVYLALFLIVLGNSLLDILFPESSRTPGMDGCQLIAVAYLIKATILDVELAHYLCQRGAFSLAGVMRHLAVLFMQPVSGLASAFFLFLSLLSLLKEGRRR